MIKIERLVKYYGSFLALDGLSLRIDKGELFGFVGPNGAGKTTTMKIIAGLLPYESGELWIDGEAVVSGTGSWKEKIGYMPDFFGVYDNLKVMEYMEVYASVYGMEGRETTRYLYELLDHMGLSDKADAYVDHLSRGMKQRLCLARALIHDPPILILDEPASGMEPRARYELREILRQLSADGKTIIVSSHILPDLAEMCTSIGIIEKGKMVVKGTVEQIMSRFNASNPLVMQFTSGQETGMRILKENPLTQNIASRGNSVSVIFHGGAEEEADLLAQLISKGARVSSYRREEGNLEELFLRLTEGEDHNAGKPIREKDSY